MNVYSGFYYANEYYTDNIRIFRSYLSGNQDCRMDGMDVESVKRNVAFLMNFPPDIPHNRLVAHRLEIFAVRNPVWPKKGEGRYEMIGFVLQKKRPLMVPKGNLESIMSLDFGSYIKSVCDEELSMREYLENMTVDLGDGTVIEGVRIKKSNYHGPANRRIIPNEHFDITYNSSRYWEAGNFEYYFEIKKPIAPEQPKEFHIQQYVVVDGKNVQERNIIVKTAFKASYDGNRPEEFSHFVFSGKKSKYFLQFDPKFLVTH